MRFAVLGMGRTGHTMASYLMNKGQEVSVWDRKPDKVDKINSRGIKIEGVLKGHFKPSGFISMEDTLKEVDYIFVMTTANGHDEIARKMKNKLKQGQRIIIFNSNWGAYEFFNILKDEIIEKNIVVGETGGMLLMSELKEVGSCYLKSIKKSLSFGTIPASSCKSVLKELELILPQLKGVDNVLETSLNATNPIIHAPINLFNLSRIENGEDFLMYGDATTHLSVKYIKEIDRERIALLNTIGLSGSSCLDMLNDAWGSAFESLYDLLRNTKAYDSAKGPNSLEHRHITEDIPFGIIPIMNLAKQYKLETPYIDNLVNAYELCLNTSFRDQAPDLSSLKIGELI
mgnify:FL=1